ncbi:MAG: hypothetical protein H7301_00905 [Cryobacterium sp.]|nr:hypothetical protein [Oligoflexia bacterium]
MFGTYFNVRSAQLSSLARMLLGVVSAVGISSCNFDYQKSGSEGTKLGGSLSENPGFEDIRANILQPACLSCHSTRSPQLTSYEAVIANLADIESDVLVRHTMPKKGPLSQELQTLLATWIRNGAPQAGAVRVPDPTPSPAPGSIPRPFTYSDLKSRVMEQKCISCHFAENPDGITPFDTYRSLMSVETFIEPLVMGISGTVVTPPEDRMPPPEAAQLTQDERAYFLLWLNDGKLEK